MTPLSLSLALLLASGAAHAGGAETFQANCVPCHGAEGRGDGPVGGALPVKPANFTDPAFWQTRDRAHLRKVITKGGPAVGKSPLMAPFPALAGDDLEELISYLESFAQGTTAEAPAAPHPHQAAAPEVANSTAAPPAHPESIDLAGMMSRPEPDPKLGGKLYREKCAVCHGAKGDGAGPAARQMDPAPRDLTTGQFKFRSTKPGTHASSWDLYQTISRGLRGTAMPGWGALPSAERWQLTYYVNALADLGRARSVSTRPSSPRGPLLHVAGRTVPASLTRSVGSKPQPLRGPLSRTLLGPATTGETPSLWVPDPPPATPLRVARGAAVFQQQGCAACHGADGHGDGPAAVALIDAWGDPIRPFDMRGAPKGGSRAVDIYRTIMSGIGGTPMPGFYGNLSADQTWDLVYFVESLAMDPQTVR